MSVTLGACVYVRFFFVLHFDMRDSLSTSWFTRCRLDGPACTQPTKRRAHIRHVERSTVIVPTWGRVPFPVRAQLGIFNLALQFDSAYMLGKLAMLTGKQRARARRTDAAQP